MNNGVKRTIAEEMEKRTGSLDLSGRNLIAIPVDLIAMDWLTVLHIRSNQISRLENLPSNLRILDIRLNRIGQLENLPSSLIRLNISENLISQLENLPSSLNRLNINSNQIGQLENLPSNLIVLNIRSNQISKLENLPTSLNRLDISSNQFLNFKESWETILESELKIVWKEYSNKVNQGELNLYENPWENPPIDIVKQGHETIVRYMAELKKGEEKLMESRLLIVGQGGAGKTSLKRKLIDCNAELPDEIQDSTRGIEVANLGLKTTEGEDFKLNIWDFGGQNIQHYAHQFFLSESCLYVLVHNQKKQHTDFQYWLNIIEMLGKSSPIVIVQNEVAGYVEPIENAALIKDRFKNVQSPFYQTNLLEAASDPRFENLKNVIAEIASNPELLSHFGQVRPASFVRIRKALDEEKTKVQFIEWKKYEEICEENGVTNKELMRDYVNTFSFLGVCLHFPEDLELRNLIFLHPKWVIDALFELLYHDIVIEQKGVFSELDSLQIWKDKKYDTMRGKLIRLMSNFQLCYKVDGEEKDKYIVPQRLQPMDEAFPWEEPQFVRVVFAYKFMPKGVITRLTCRLYQNIEGEHVWNDAVILSKRNIGRVLIRERYAEDEIWIEAAGDKKSNLINLVVETINRIHKESKYANLQVELKLPCICDACLYQENPHYFEYRDVVESIKEGDDTLKCKDSRKRVNLRKLLAYYFEDGDQEPAYVKEFRGEFARNLEMHTYGYEQQDRIYNKIVGLETLVRRLPATFQQELTLIQNNFNQLNLPEDKMETWLAEVKSAVALLPVENEWKQRYLEIERSQDSQMESKGVFELTLPIIPGILTYKGELSVGFGSKLKKIWEELKGGKFFEEV